MCSLFYLKAKNVEKLKTNLLNYFLRSKTMFAIFEQNNKFFFQLFLGILFFLLSSFFSHSEDYFVSRWFPHSFGPWYLLLGGRALPTPTSMLINIIISSCIHPHSPTFVETISAELHLMPPSALTAVISVPPGQSSSSSAEVCTALPHLSQVQGILVLFPRDDLQSWDCRN